MQYHIQVEVSSYKGSTLGIIYFKIPRGDMMGGGIKCDPDNLFRITKKEAELVKKLPRHQQDEFEEYLKLKFKFNCLSITIQKKGATKTF